MFKSIPDILEALQEKRLPVSKLSKETGIPAARIYKWKDRNSKITAEDAATLENWAGKLDNSPKGEVSESDLTATAKELLALYRERIAELKEDKEWLKRTIDSNLMGLIFGQKSVLAHVATILEKDNEREAAGNKKKLEQLKDDTDKRIGEKFQIAARTDSVRT